MTRAERGLAAVVARRARAVRPAGLPEGARTAAQAHVLDCLGLAIAGRSSDRVRRASAVDGGPDPVVLLSLACGALGLDDFDEVTRAHPGAVIVPALLVAAVDARRPVPGNRLATAVFLGYELIAWLGAAMDAGQMHPRGRHPSAVLGVPSVALAAAWLAELGEEKTAAALGIGAGLSFGLTQFDAHEEMRALQTAMAASAGLRAARFAAAGFPASDQSLEGAGGLFGGDMSRVLPVEAIGAVPSALERVSFKPYPHFSDLHPVVAALLSALELVAPDPHHVVAVRAFLSEKAASRLHRGPAETVREAKRSAAFVLAFALRSTSPDGPDLRLPFTESDVADPRTRSLARLIDVTATRELNDAGSAAVEIMLSDGRCLGATSAGYPGDGRDPRLRWSLEQARARFRAVAGRGERRDACDSAIRLVDQLVTPDDVRAEARVLVRELAPSHAPTPRSRVTSG